MIPPEIEAVIPQLEKKWAGRTSRKNHVPLREFIQTLYETGSTYAAAKSLGVDHSSLAGRRRNIEKTIGYKLPVGRTECWSPPKHLQTQHLTIENGTMLLISDTHFWPNVYSTAWAAFLGIAAALKPTYMCVNGDGMDGAGTSRHPPDGFAPKPMLKDEIKELQERLHDAKLASMSSKHIYAPGNHDVGRLDRYVAMNAPQLEGMPGLTFEELLIGWTMAGRFVVNDHRKVKCPPVIPTIIKHAFKRSGIHATYNAVKDEGCHIIHGHLHKHRMADYTDYMGTKYGVDCGVGAAVDSPQFGYMQLNTTGWQSGGVLLTWEDYKLQPPELFTVTDEDQGKFRFRGQTYTVNWE